MENVSEILFIDKCGCRVVQKEIGVKNTTFIERCSLHSDCSVKVATQGTKAPILTDGQIYRIVHGKTPPITYRPGDLRLYIPETSYKIAEAQVKDAHVFYTNRIMEAIDTTLETVKKTYPGVHWLYNQEKWHKMVESVKIQFSRDE